MVQPLESLEEDICSPADAVIDTVTAQQQEAFETIEAAGVAMLSGVALARKEIADFVSERLRQDVEAQRQLVRCRSFGELGALQRSYIRTAVGQYATEAARLVRLGNETVARSLERNG